MADIDPTNPFEFLFRILFAIFVGIAIALGAGDLGGGTPANPSESQSAQPAQVLTVIETVEPIILESSPVQMSVHVTGYQPDGCDYPVQVEQRRDGNTVTVKIYREVPPDILCTMQLVPYDDTIQLDGSFEPGEYTIDVNGTVATVTV